MNLNNKRVLFAAHYAAPYEGNFIASLKMLEQRLKANFGVLCAYLFPVEAKSQAWMDKFSAEHRVFFSGERLSEGVNEVLESFHPDLVYTHFEGYDLPLYRAIRKSGKRVCQVWHMHDTITYLKHPIKALYQCLCFFRHYGIPLIKTKWGGEMSAYQLFVKVNPHL